MDNPVDPKIVQQLTQNSPISCAPTPKTACRSEDFDTFGSTRRTLRQFLAAGAELNAIIRDLMVPNPDKK